MMYLNQESAASSYAELSSGSSLSLHDRVRVSSIGAGDEVEPLNVEPALGRLNFTTGDSVDNTVNEDSLMGLRTPIHVIGGEQNLRCQGLSLSLGTQIPSRVYVPSFHYQYVDSGASSLLSSYVQAEDGSRSKESRNVEYLSYDLPGGTNNNIEGGALNGSCCFVRPDEMHYSSNLCEPSGLVSTILDSQYLKATQQLLDEVVNVHRALKLSEIDDKHSNSHEFGLHGSKEIDMKMNGYSSDSLELITVCSSELSPSEWQDLLNKLTKLLTMLDEVDRRYRQYYHQMQIVVSSFEMVAGGGAAETYTTLALKTISRHFRTLRDTINSQIRVTRQKLGEQGSTPTGQGGLPRLWYVDQQLRQQRALQHVGVMRHSWRPQRGLPETSVSILRAWLFVHFLHPYPKDSEKIMLARQTGLTRNQVANWFINARVRLWKPMVEEMYKEEFGELDFKSSPEHAPEAPRDKSRVPKVTGEELQESMTTKGADGDLMDQFDDSKSDIGCDVGIHGCTARLGFQNGACGDDSIGISELGSFSVGKQVSLALGLRYCDKDSLSMAGGIQFRGDLLRASSVGHDTSDYPCADPVNQTWDH